MYVCVCVHVSVYVLHIMHAHNCYKCHGEARDTRKGRGSVHKDKDSIYLNTCSNIATTRAL